MSNPSNSSGFIAATAGTAVCTRAAVVTSVIAIADGTNVATVTLFDSASAATAGTEMVQIVVPAGARTDLFHADGGVLANRGVYITVVGTNSKAIVHYRLA